MIHFNVCCFTLQSDSEKHYGSELEGEEEEEEEGDEFASSLPPATTAGSECSHASACEQMLVRC